MMATFREGGLVAWAEASGQRRTSGRAGGGLRFAFYGRCRPKTLSYPRRYPRFQSA